MPIAHARSEDSNNVISPLGPKPQVLGYYLATKEYFAVQTVIAVPRRYEEEYFSRGVGRVWKHN